MWLTKPCMVPFLLYMYRYTRRGMKSDVKEITNAWAGMAGGGSECLVPSACVSPWAPCPANTRTVGGGPVSRCGSPGGWGQGAPERGGVLAAAYRLCGPGQVTQPLCASVFFWSRGANDTHCASLGPPFPGLREGVWGQAGLCRGSSDPAQGAGGRRGAAVSTGTGAARPGWGGGSPAPPLCGPVTGPLTCQVGPYLPAPRRLHAH